jgi:hypothetical protein
MANENIGELDALIQEKLDADTDFAESLADLSDEDKEQAIQDKKSELLMQEFKSLSEKAKEAEKAKELAENYKIRAEKAEKASKKGNSEGEKTPKNERNEEMSSRDIIALTNANIAADEDIDVVLDYAKFKKISVVEALKSSVVKATLAENEEHRKTAAATNTGTGRRGVQQKSEGSLLSEFKSGKVPETDDEMERLALARMKARAGK